MSKLYVFGIGGTGSRVLKALTMLLASGVRCGSTIVPVIIDPDQAAANMTQFVGLADLYNQIHTLSSFDNNDCFFKTDIQKVTQLQVTNSQNVSFDQFMKVSTMNPASQALCKALFSIDNLNSNMQVGFKGNPNIGSVVLNQFTTSTAFNNLANSFQPGDRIFIISSIFGGTGASGFPLLLKNLRTNNQLPNFALINNAPIGAITVLPYFNLQSNTNSAIDSSTFISKTKSALAYYANNISANNSLDFLFYIGDQVTTNLVNCDGGAGQNNPAHFIELASALAILDFAQSAMPNPRQTQHKEFGINNINNTQMPLTFNDLSNVTNTTIKQRLIQMFMFSKYLKTTFKREIKYQPWAKMRRIDDSFTTTVLFDSITKFMDEFDTWLNDMSKTQRAFSPFANGDTTNIFEMVSGIEPKKSTFKTRFKSYALIDNFLNAEDVDKQKTTEEGFLKLFDAATSKSFNAKF